MLALAKEQKRRDSVPKQSLTRRNLVITER